MRVNLAACYRLAAHFRMTDLIYMYYLERACQTQVNGMAGGAQLRIPAHAVAEKTAAQFKALPYKAKQPEWKAHLRMLDKMDPSYKN